MGLHTLHFLVLSFILFEGVKKTRKEGVKMLKKKKNSCQKSVGRSEESCHDKLQHCIPEELLYTFNTLAVSVVIMVWFHS